jgi:ArsR family transcriptional regulator
MEDATLVRALKALADATRFRMVREIAAAGELSCGQVGETFPLKQPTISHHIKILSDAGLINVRREAQHAFISVNKANLSQVLGLLPERLEGAPESRAAGTRAKSKRSR